MITTTTKKTYWNNKQKQTNKQTIKKLNKIIYKQITKLSQNKLKINFTKIRKGYKNIYPIVWTVYKTLVLLRLYWQYLYIKPTISKKKLIIFVSPLYDDIYI